MQLLNPFECKIIAYCIIVIQFCQRGASILCNVKISRFKGLNGIQNVNIIRCSYNLLYVTVFVLQ